MSVQPRLHGISLALAALAATAFAGCKPAESPYDKAVRQAMTAYGDLAYKAHLETGMALDGMLERTTGFFENPDAQAYNHIKVQWEVSRDRWAQAEVFVVEGSPAEAAYPFINLSQLDPGFVDYTSSDASTGLVNDTAKYPDLTKELLVQAHQLDGPASVSVGFHPIEYLLWGQDYDLESPGKRPYTDYLTDENGTRDNQGRRGAYLRMATELLIEDIKAVRDGWKADEGEWRTEFDALEGEERVRRVVVALARLSLDEVEDTRLAGPLLAMEQHTDHCPFSDRSHKDLYADAVAIQNLYLGRYDEDLLDELVPEEGPGLHTVVAHKASALDEQFRLDLQATVDAMDALRAGPALEQALLAGVGSPERALAERALSAVQQQNATLEQIANLFGFSLQGGDDGTETGEGSGTGEETGTTETDTGTTGTDSTTDSSSDDTMGTIFVPGPDMG